MERWFSPRAARNLPQLLLGVVMFGVGIALMAQSGLGLGAWSVLHEGISVQSGLALGTVDLLLSVPILAAWFPLHQNLGLGTVAAGFLIGPITNVWLSVLPAPSELALQLLLMALGSVSIAIGSGLYLSADLGPGPRDGLMTGIHQRFGWSIRRVRMVIELSVLTLGFTLGGTVGLGTVVHAIAIGPMVQITLGWWDKKGAVMRDPTRTYDNE